MNPKYCLHCGSPLIELYREPGYYDEHTGKKARQYFIVCPNYKKGIRGWLDWHTREMAAPAPPWERG